MSQLRETSKRKEKKGLCAFTAACDCCHVIIPLSVCPPGRGLRQNSLTLPGEHSLQIHPGLSNGGGRHSHHLPPHLGLHSRFYLGSGRLQVSAVPPQRWGLFLSEVLWVETFRKQKYKEQYKLLQQHTSIRTEVPQHNHTNPLSWTDCLESHYEFNNLHVKANKYYAIKTQYML